jgi:DNA-binding GntR family transcriptional regulator
MKLKTKSERSYRILKEGLLTGVFSPGDRLTEAHIARKLGLGRVPVREAMLRLQAEGLLKSRGPYGGKYVEYLEDQKPEDILHRYELREIIEGQAARLAAKNMTGWQIDELRKRLQRMWDCAANNDREGRNQAGRDLHHFFISNCGNPLLLKIWEEYHLMPLTVRSASMEEKIKRGLGEHRDEKEQKLLQAIEAIAAHDADRAEQCMREFVRNITEAIRQASLEE